MRIRGVILGSLAAAMVVGGCGGGSKDSMSHDKADADTRTVEVEMRDIAYAPTALAVRAGETVQFVFRNTGEIPHDAFLGDEAAQAEHEKEMRGGGGGMGDHSIENDAITVQPGTSGAFTHKFAPGESLVIGCHQAGHYQAGMKLALTVS
jgi:uncharacterized cupredoxin-like copper-binding protein